MKKGLLQMSFLGIGLAFTILGVFRDEVSIVFIKSINICLECIGIG